MKPNVSGSGRIQALFLILFMLAPAAAWGAVQVADSCSYADVNAAIQEASSGDLVMVPSGSCTWSAQLLIDKGIVLRGAGADFTIITGNSGGSSYVVRYEPSNPSLNEKFDLSGFTFTSSNTSMLALLNNSSYKLTNIRIHDNIFNTRTNSVPNMYFTGQTYGSFDNNTITGAFHVDIYGRPAAGGVRSWNSDVLYLGGRDYMYFEDNALNVCFTTATHGHGGRGVWRFNSYNLTNPSECYASLGGFYPLIDIHGNQTSGVYAGMGLEVYGNVINNSSYKISPFVDQRGGTAMVFNNTETGSGSINTRVREENPDSISPPAEHSITGQAQHVSNSYYWENRDSSDALINASQGEDCCDELDENSEYFNQDESFDGTSGIGVGVLADIPGTCTTGVGYWATDQGNWNLNGAEEGVLYKCIGINQWERYYEPFFYPHPLRSGDNVSPAAPESLDVEPQT